MSLTVYSDADHAGCQDTRRSTSGSAQFLRDKLVSWSSKKQKNTSISSKEEQVENGIVELYFVRTEYQLANIFTKPLPRERFNFLIEKLDMRSMSSKTLKKNQRVIGKYKMRINPGMKPKEPTYQVVLDALALTTCYLAFLITECSSHLHASVLGYQFDKPPSEKETLSFIRELGHSREIKYITDGMFHKKNLDFVALIWEDLAYQIDNKDSKKQDKMYYPRFTKAIIHHFLTKDKSISMRNRTFMHTAQDDSLLGTMRFVSRHEDTQKPTTKPKPTKKKALIKADRGKGDGTDFESGVPGVPKYDYESKKESWGDNGEEEDDDEDDTEDESDNDGNDDDGGNDDNDDDSDDKRTESDKDKNPNLNLSNEEHEEKEEEYADERVHTPKNHKLTDEEDNAKKENEEEKDNAEELYRDVNVNLRKEDVEMTDADQDRTDQYNVSQVSRFEQVEEDAHVTLTVVRDTQKTEADNEIASLMDTTVRHEEPNGQTSSLFTIPVKVIPEITSAFTTTIPPPPPSLNPLQQQATPTPTPIASEVTTSFPTLPDFSSVFKFNDRLTNLEKDLPEMKQVDRYAQSISSILAIILPQAVSDFSTPVIKQNVTESIEAVVLAKSSSQPKSTYAAAASLSKFELTKILMEKMEEHKLSHPVRHKCGFVVGLVVKED
ncbi:hypothetical protein Tco_0754076 [Tanacetum coccineum]